MRDLIAALGGRIRRATREESPANIAFISSSLYTLNLNLLLREDTRDILESDVALYRRAARRHPRSCVTLLILGSFTLPHAL